MVSQSRAGRMEDGGVGFGDDVPMGVAMSGTVSPGHHAPMTSPPRPVIDISSSQNPSLRNVTHQSEPSTGSWNGPQQTYRGIGMRLSTLEAAVQLLQIKVSALSDHVVPQMSRMEAKLGKIDDVFGQFLAIHGTPLNQSSPSNIATPTSTGRGRRIGQGSEDYMIRKMLLDTSAKGLTSSTAMKTLDVKATNNRREDANTKRKTVGKKLFSPRAGRVMRDVDGHRKAPVDVDDSSNEVEMADSDLLVIPQWIPVSFNPTKDMLFNGDEVAVWAYIFSLQQAERSPKEVIVDHTFVDGTRDRLLTLAPPGKLVDDVITMVSCILSHDERTQLGKVLRWWLPTQFTHYALQWDRDPATVGNFYRGTFMGEADHVMKIYIPMFDNEAQHWFLIIVDLIRSEIVYLDSKPAIAQKRLRERMIRRVSVFLEEMLEQRSFYKYPQSPVPHVSVFPIVTPAGLPEQANGVDCGVWVCKWMLLADRLGSYALGPINNLSRVRLAIDLVLHPYNAKKDEILARARKFMEENETVDECDLH